MAPSRNLSDPRRLLFAYGSLLMPTGIAAVDEALARWTRPLGAASMPGRLYALGAYPGLKPAEGPGDGGPRVKGRLLFLTDPAKALAALDRYEDFRPQAPSGSEFVRALAQVALGRATVTGQVYFYNRGVRGRRPIAGGDYLAWRRARGITSAALSSREFAL